VITSTIGGLNLFTEPQILLGNTGGVRMGLDNVALPILADLPSRPLRFWCRRQLDHVLHHPVFLYINWRVVRER